MSIPIITTIISAMSIIAGSLIGALCSYLISTRIHKKQIQNEHALLEENHNYEEYYRANKLCDNANVIRLDIATALFQSIRSIQNNEETRKYLYLLPINKDYSNMVASLSNKYTFTELSDLYQLYGIIEKVNRDIYNWEIGNNEYYENIKVGFITILFKVYGENYKNILLIDIDKISYKDLYKNNYIRPCYKEVLTKLNLQCSYISRTK